MNSYFLVFRIKNSLMSPILRQMKFSPISICHNVKYTTLGRPATCTKLINHALPLKSPLHLNYRQTSLLTLAKDPKHYNKHASVWCVQRVFALAILFSIPILASGFYIKKAEAILDIFIAIHIQWGLEAICLDYLRPAVVGNFIPKCIPAFTALVTLGIGSGLIYVTLKGRGVLQTIHQLWNLETDKSYEEKHGSFYPAPEDSSVSPPSK